MNTKKLEEFLKSHNKPEADTICKHGNTIQAYVPRDSNNYIWWDKTIIRCAECEKEKRLAEDIDKVLNIPSRYHKVKASDKYLKEFKEKEGVSFCGLVGSGKTHEAIALIKFIYLEFGLKSKLISAPDFAHYLSASIGDKTLNDFITELETTDILLLDDMGAEKDSEFITANLYKVIDTRYNNRKPLIITSNLDSTSFYERYGTRILSRMEEMCSSVILEGKDRRLG